jgi:hypothetical protein
MTAFSRDLREYTCQTGTQKGYKSRQSRQVLGRPYLDEEQVYLGGYSGHWRTIVVASCGVSYD